MYLDAENMITRVTLRPIPTRLTEEEDFRIKNYIENPQFNSCKHDYIDRSSPYMFRCPLVTCKYSIINPQNIKENIIERCKHFHKNNEIHFQYKTKLEEKQIDYPKPENPFE